MRRTQPAKGVHDAPYRAEQTDEWRRARRGTEKRERLFELGDLDARRALHGARYIVDAAELRRERLARGRENFFFAARDPQQLFVAGAENLRDRPRFQVAARIVDRGQISAVPKNLDEFFRLSLGAAHLVGFVKNDAPAQYGKKNQQVEHALHERTGSLNEIQNAVLLGHRDIALCHELKK